MNVAANDAYIQQYYPNENFISNAEKYQSINEYTKNIVIPENVKIAESRIPKSLKQQSDLIKELRQSEILTRIGNSVYLIPEHPKYKQRLLKIHIFGIQAV